MEFLLFGVGIVLSSLVLLHPVSIWLSRRVFSAPLFLATIATCAATWGLYQGLARAGVRESRPMLFVTSIVVIGGAAQTLWLWTVPAVSRALPEDRRIGWVLFTAVMSLGATIAVPLFAALFRVVLS